MSNKNLSLFDNQTIFDITNDGFSLNKKNALRQYPKSIPYWGRIENITYSDIEKTTPQQKNFYTSFKDSFLKGIYYNLDFGSSNYIFILVFDFLREYEKDKDLQKLSRHFTTLKKNYYDCISWCNFFLKEILIKIGDEKALANHIKNIKYELDYRSLDTSNFVYGYKYKIKLNLSDSEVVHLNQINLLENSFNTIEPAQIEIFKLYLKTLAGLIKSYVEDNITIDIAFKTVADIIARKNFRFRNGSRNYYKSINNSYEDFVQYILKSCENEVRKKYIVKTKIIKGSTLFHVEAKKVFDSLIVQKVAAVIEPLIQDIEEIDASFEVELNTLNPSRWKVKFEMLKNSYSGNLNTFSEAVHQLYNLNPGNQTIENLYLDAAKFIVNDSKEVTLSFYIQYIDKNRIKDIYKAKPLPRNFNKLLFADKKQQEKYEAIVEGYKKDNDLANALQQIPKIYEVVRKKISIDSETVKDVQKSHAETVELLEEYLKDEQDEVIHQPMVTKPAKEVKATVDKKTAKAKNAKPQKTTLQSKFLATINFNEIDITLLEMFEKNNFSMLQSTIEQFAKSNGVFKNQLIEHINDLCFDVLDDLLIEEEDENFTINKQYFSKLAA